MNEGRISEANKVRAMSFIENLGKLSEINQTYVLGLVNGMTMSAILPDKPKESPKRGRGRPRKTEEGVQ